MSTLSPGASAPRPAEPSPPPRRTSSFASSLSSSSRGGGGAGSSSRHSATALSRQAARLGIVTNYRDLNLHSAAAKGNVGLVQYALANGQPVNSVLDGVLPIHAAASAGNETVVRMLVEAGADVNSPRLSRRFTREGTKSSGQSVGTRGSTPLHFAAANGHLLILSLLLSYGADPRVPEKHGATAEQMAAQNGFLDAADLLHSYCVKLDQAAADVSGSGGPSFSQTRPHRNHPGRTFAGLRRKSSASSGSTPAMQAQRSFDALATKFAHHAHRASSSSSLSVNSLRGLTPLASSSQISLGAADGPAPLAPVPVRRRPSLPGGTMQPVLEVGNDGRVRAATFSGGGSGQQASMSTAFPTTSTHPTSEQDAEGEEAAAVERAERRRSMDVNRPWRQDSFQTGLPTLASLDMASLPPPEVDDPDPTPTDSKTALLPASAPTSPTRTLPQQRFYRPRQSSGLSRGSFTGSRGSIEEDSETRVFEDDELPPVAEPAATTPEEACPGAKPNRPRAVSNPDSRSPLLQHLHATQYSGARSPRSRENSHSETSSPAKQGHNLAVPSPTSTRPTARSDGRARSNSASTDASYTVSTSSSRDSIWSGPTFSTASTSTAPTTAPSHSPTKRTKTSTVTPDVGYFGAAAAAATTALDLSNRRRHLGPLYEAHSPGIATTRSTTTRTEDAASSTTNDHEPKTRAQARSRVKKAERELMGSLAPASASASTGTGSASVLRETASAPKSLKDQLAAYGKSLRAERELVEKEERERQRHVKSPAASGYTIETISTSSVAKARSNLPPNPLNASTTRGSGKLLLPPSPPSSRRSRSPGSSAATTPRALREANASSPSKARSPHMEQVRASSPSSTRSGSNQSASTAEAVPVPSAVDAAAAAAPPVLGQGHGGVSYVGVQPPTRSHHRHHQHQHHHSSNSSSNHRKDGPAHTRNGSRTARSSDKSQSDRDLASVVGGSSSNGGGAPSNSNAGKISTRNGVEEERRKREEEEHKVPRAARTVPAGRTGFVRKLFGGSSSKESGGASPSRR